MTCRFERINDLCRDVFGFLFVSYFQTQSGSINSSKKASNKTWDYYRWKSNKDKKTDIFMFINVISRLNGYTIK